MTWWACLVRVRCAAFNIDFAVPAEDTSASYRADVHPEPSSKFPSTFQTKSKQLGSTVNELKESIQFNEKDISDLELENKKLQQDVCEL